MRPRSAGSSAASCRSGNTTTCAVSGAFALEGAMSQHRIEHDTMGDIEVPADKLWGAQTQRSLIHFHFPGETMPIEVVHAQVLVKKACATVNMALGALDRKKGEAIVRAADEALTGKLDEHFPLVVWQTG